MLYDFVKNCGTNYLATVDGNQPHVRPFGTTLLFGKNRPYKETIRDIRGLV